MPDNIIDFIKMCLKWDSKIGVKAAGKKSGGWKGGNKKPDNTNNTTPTPKAPPAETVVGYYGPAPIDLSTVKGRRLHLKKDRGEEKGNVVCIAETVGILQQVVQGN
jgi:hypothetical protein